MNRTFSEEQIIQRLRLENNWWESGGVDAEYKSMKRRLYFQGFHQLVIDHSVKRAVVLMGPRRVGKTVMILHSIQSLIDGGVPANRICYVSIETPIYNGVGLEELITFCRNATGGQTNDAYYFFFDEIQYLKDWELHLKSLVDTFRKTKFIVSGSAAAALRLKSNESGAGRFTDFILPPLSFQEYLLLGNFWKENDNHELEALVGFTIDEINRQFADYLNFGGYPEVTLSETIRSNPGRFIKNDIIDKVLLRDLPSLYGIDDIQELNSLFTYLAYNTGNEMSLEELSQNSSISKNTIKKYLSYLEAAFLIKIVNRIDLSAKKFKRATCYKIYLTNPSLRCALFNKVEDTDPMFGHLVESAILSHCSFMDNTLYYSRWDKGEVDLVTLGSDYRPFLAAEIKWSDRYFDNPLELKSLLEFCKKHQLKACTITTKTVMGEKTINDVILTFMPSSIYAFIVGSINIKTALKSVTDLIEKSKL